MGAYCSRAKPFKMLFQGLDAAGKTTILYQLKVGEVVTTIPTIGFNVEQVSVGGIQIVAWDVGGREKARPLHRHYYPNTDGFVFVIDSKDQERFDQALDELDRFILNDEMTRGSVLMILANKQDLENVLSLEKIENEVQERLSSQGPTAGERVVFVRGCSAKTNNGLLEAFSLFGKMIKQHKAGEIIPGFKSIQSLEGESGEVTGIGGKADNQSYFHSLKKMLNIPFVKSLLFY